jgi:hypothetical protein
MGKDTEVDATRLGAAGVSQLGEERAEFAHETDTSVDVGDQHYFGGHRELRVWPKAPEDAVFDLVHLVDRRSSSATRP